MMRRQHEMSTNDPSNPRTTGKTVPWPFFTAIAGLAILMFLLRMAAPSNLLDQDQERPAAYVLDAVRNGNWLCQRDLSGDITSKPPMWTWLAAGFSVMCGEVNRFTLYLPNALAALATAMITVAVAGRFFGARVAFYAGLATLLHTAGFKEMGLARTDGVFALTVALTAVLAYRSWRTGRGWTWFWLAAAISTLTKGPLGLAFASCGLLAHFWERKTDNSITLRGSHWLGISLFFLVSGGWFYLSYLDQGQALIDKMIGRELVGHLATSNKGAIPGTVFWKSPMYYLARTLPWSLLGCAGLWRIWKRPASDPNERRLERFLFCSFLGGMAILSIAPHQRADLLWPLLPAAALISARELDLRTRHWSRRKANLSIAVLIALMMAGYAVSYFVINPRKSVVKETIALQTMAEQLKARVGAEFPLTHVNDLSALQLYLNTARPWVSAERAATLLRSSEAAFVGVYSPDNFKPVRLPDDPEWFTVLRDESGTDLKTVIIANRPVLEESDDMAFAYGPLTVRLHGTRLVSANQRSLHARATTPDASTTVTNDSDAALPFRIVIDHGGNVTDEAKILLPQETWSVKVKP